MYYSHPCLGPWRAYLVYCNPQLCSVCHHHAIGTTLHLNTNRVQHCSWTRQERRGVAKGRKCLIPPGM